MPKDECFLRKPFFIDEAREIVAYYKDTNFPCLWIEVWVDFVNKFTQLRLSDGNSQTTVTHYSREQLIEEIETYLSDLVSYRLTDKWQEIIYGK